VLAGGVLVVSKDSVGADGFLAGLDPDDGRILWKVDRKSDRTPFSTPVAFEESPGQWRVIFSSNPAALTCLDPATGKVVWQHDNPQPEQRPVSSPVIANGICFATVGQGGKANAAVAVRTKDGSLAWEGGKGLPYVPTPASAGKHFFLLSDGGILSAVEAASGKQIWSERVFSDQAYSSPVHTGDRIVCISRSGKVAIVAANPESFQLLGSSELSDPCDATPAIAGGRLVIRTARRLLCLTGSRAQP
jgi:outer membrane protein assembly factor BamB